MLRYPENIIGLCSRLSQLCKENEQGIGSKLPVSFLFLESGQLIRVWGGATSGEIKCFGDRSHSRPPSGKDRTEWAVYKLLLLRRPGQRDGRSKSKKDVVVVAFVLHPSSSLRPELLPSRMASSLATSQQRSFASRNGTKSAVFIHGPLNASPVKSSPSSLIKFAL